MNISSYLLLAIGIVFLLQLTVAPFNELFIFDPLLALSEPWRILTSMFMHGGLSHLFWNAFVLLMFGSVLERQMSTRDFLTIYFGAGLVGTFLYYATYLFGIIPPIPAWGASGAIVGLLGAAAILLPNMRILLFFILPMSMRHAAILMFVLYLIGSFNIGSGVADAAHLGGMIFGLIFAWMLKRQMTSAQSWEWQTEFR